MEIANYVDKVTPVPSPPLLFPVCGKHLGSGPAFWGPSGTVPVVLVLGI